MHENSGRRTDTMQLPIASRSYANARDIGQHHSEWYHKVKDRHHTGHCMIRTDGRCTLRWQPSLMHSVLRNVSQPGAPFCGLLFQSAPSLSISLHCFKAVMITLISTSKQHVVGLWSGCICSRARTSGIHWSTRRLPFGFQERRRIFLDQFKVSLSFSKPLTKQVGAAVTLCNYDRKLTVTVPGGPTAVLTEGFIWYFSLPAGKSTFTFLRLARPFPFKSVHIHNSSVTPNIHASDSIVKQTTKQRSPTTLDRVHVFR
jgi:hypothetical protein